MTFRTQTSENFTTLSILDHDCSFVVVMSHAEAIKLASLLRVAAGVEEKPNVAS